MTPQFPWAEARAAPQRPPMSAWLELEGKPIHQVKRFQTMAPSSAHITVFKVMKWLSTKSLPIVLATAVKARAPRRLKTVARAMAWRGVMTRVETLVAMAFAVSWKPLMYSKASATIRTTKMSVIPELLRSASGQCERRGCQHHGSGQKPFRAVHKGPS